MNQKTNEPPFVKNKPDPSLIQKKDNVTFVIMLTRSFLLMGCVLLMQASAQPAPDDSLISDEEQKQLKWCYIYSNLLGFEIDTIQHPALFENVSEWLGTRYSLGGNSKRGVDCSGFVCELYKNAFDIVLEGNSSDLFKRLKPLKKAELNEGDLVFFKIRKKMISHLGIYLGHNKFAHASLKQGVTISDLDDPYYKKYFYKGGRLDVQLSGISPASPKR